MFVRWKTSKRAALISAVRFKAEDFSSLLAALLLECLRLLAWASGPRLGQSEIESATD